MFGRPVAAAADQALRQDLGGLGHPLPVVGDGLLVGRLLGQVAVDDDLVRGHGRAQVGFDLDEVEDRLAIGVEQRGCPRLDRREDADAGPERLDDRVADSRRRHRSERLGAQVADDRQGGCRRHRGHARRLSSRRDQHATSRRSRGTDAERTGRRAGCVVALRLREHDLQLRGRLGGDRALPRQRPAVRRARRERAPVDRDRGLRRPECRGLADPRRLLGPWRATDAVPAVLHAPVHRRDLLHRRCAAGPRPGAVHRRELRVPGRAHLLRRDAQDRVVPGDARQALGDRHGGRLPRDGLRRAPDLLPRHRRRRPVPAHGHPVPAVRDPHLLVRPRAAPGRRAAADPPRHHRRGRPAPALASPTPGRSPACGGSSSAASSTRTRSTPSSSS